MKTIDAVLTFSLKTVLIILFILSVQTHGKSQSRILKESGPVNNFFETNGNLGLGNSIFTPTSRFHIKTTSGFADQSLLFLEVLEDWYNKAKIQFCVIVDNQPYGIYQKSASGSILNYFEDNLKINNFLIGMDNQNNPSIVLDQYVPYFNFKFNSHSGPSTTPLSINANGIQVDSKTITNEFQLLNGCATDRVLISDSSGNARWKDLYHLLPEFWISCQENSIFTNKDRVGIGTDDPSEKLEITHNDPTGGIVIDQTGEGGQTKSEIKFNLAGVEQWAIGSYIPRDRVNSFFIWSHNQSKTALFIDGVNGMTGIGTEWPRAQLEVAGNFKATAVGIGIDPPSVHSDYKLYVDGGIAAREVKVTVEAFPDYVFSKDYPLLSISDFDKFIAENNHLPGLPSSAEVNENNGIELGKLQVKLIEKIEEQALYIISLQKQIDELRAMIVNKKSR